MAFPKPVEFLSLTHRCSEWNLLFPTCRCEKENHCFHLRSAAADTPAAAAAAAAAAADAAAPAALIAADAAASAAAMMQIYIAVASVDVPAIFLISPDGFQSTQIAPAWWLYLGCQQIKKHGRMVVGEIQYGGFAKICIQL